MDHFTITAGERILLARFSAPQAMVSWSLTRPGFTTATRVAWVQVNDADLPPDVDPIALVNTRLAAHDLAGPDLAGHDLGDAVALMTSRDVRKHHVARARSGAATARCLATVGLANACSLKAAPEPAASQTAAPGNTACLGTINLLAHVDRPLSQAGLLEALSIASSARTAAVLACGRRVEGAPAIATGTDCIVVACPIERDPQPFAGLHTDAGRALARATHDAVLAGAVQWMDERMSSGRTE